MQKCRLFTVDATDEAKGEVLRPQTDWGFFFLANLDLGGLLFRLVVLAFPPQSETCVAGAGLGDSMTRAIFRGTRRMPVLMRGWRSARARGVYTVGNSRFIAPYTPDARRAVITVAALFFSVSVIGITDYEVHIS